MEKSINTLVIEEVYFEQNSNLISFEDSNVMYESKIEANIYIKSPVSNKIIKKINLKSKSKSTCNVEAWLNVLEDFLTEKFEIKISIDQEFINECIITDEIDFINLKEEREPFKSTFLDIFDILNYHSRTEKIKIKQINGETENP